MKMLLELRYYSATTLCWLLIELKLLGKGRCKDWNAMA